MTAKGINVDRLNNLKMQHEKIEMDAKWCKINPYEAAYRLEEIRKDILIEVLQ